MVSSRSFFDAWHYCARHLQLGCQEIRRIPRVSRTLQDHWKSKTWTMRKVTPGWSIWCQVRRPASGFSWQMPGEDKGILRHAGSSRSSFLAVGAAWWLSAWYPTLSFLGDRSHTSVKRGGGGFRVPTPYAVENMHRTFDSAPCPQINY